ncbi:SDR family oxidoreductase [Streptomyces ipomoeae]|jgi:NAD(P)-dependent dehydrogenase (short-subunit alcohol dehydrogenase family)|uniref:Oxidoreductase, short chain dehydrogenase/reductase family protein n=2 Tax=Streptomyces ipomoeae TaxID=103232 RepID=L1KWM4_9ACTN|nr:SDR family NAD(P)-dependent oxidoreductase [Streptomyces ipomoeae]EKX64954.1 oxidoreductase, short chain dehydrogenase/reductase family protein [Streptomyces ipomoeae 91-03]MDX2694302.1 SDR family NAD(P)-dependent oxidoreductase [Streptomyces ipomoeae]MDX2828479.1 SDR family NAD(P)-dependent oxidoreductase [Streptomyces ipomoeae]MDX2843128.1 SDR family NAD(P)-dependent oxidoreductase [Streptomyces ipomoeae]MDX2881080.1 SDR family NAD(P)-dependent oxidoreductase [Streptomyces ipomoeae]
MPITAYDLTGRIAFVTGAGGGIGRASAVLLAEAGATVHCADRDAQGLHETATLIKSAGGTAHTHHLDVTDRAQLTQAVAACGNLHVMAAIAGVMHSSPVLETRDEDLDRVWGVNFKGVLYACQEAARLMIARRTGGSIVTMASGAIDTGSPGLLCYGVTKAAVVQLTKTLATEVGPHGIRVNAVAPGWIRTPMTARHDSEAQARTESLMARLSPLGRVGEPDDIAHAVLHLASDASAFTTGQILRPNGGVAMPW